MSEVRAVAAMLMIRYLPFELSLPQATILP